MPAYDLLLVLDDAELGWNMFSGLVCVVYAICIFCFLLALMDNTKRTNELLAQLVSFHLPPPVSPPLPTRTLPPILVRKPASAPPKTLHTEPAGEPPKFTAQKWGSTYNETDETKDP
jgi:hypothetical protein